jgi:Zn finger protein HypA/HybF involved in hydrogenase expression
MITPIVSFLCVECGYEITRRRANQESESEVMLIRCPICATEHTATYQGDTLTLTGDRHEAEEIQPTEGETKSKAGTKAGI